MAQPAGHQLHQQQGGPSEPEALRNLMVNYIPTTIDEMQMRQLFEMYGPIESIKIVCDRETRQSKGYGFVKYRFAFSAMHAIQYLNGYPLMNKRLKVAYANVAEAQKASQQMMGEASPYGNQGQYAAAPQGMGQAPAGIPAPQGAPNQGGPPGGDPSQDPSNPMAAYMQQMAAMQMLQYQQQQQQMVMMQLQQQQQAAAAAAGGQAPGQQGGQPGQPGQQGGSLLDPKFQQIPRH